MGVVGPESDSIGGLVVEDPSGVLNQCSIAYIEAFLSDRLVSIVNRSHIFDRLLEDGHVLAGERLCTLRALDDILRMMVLKRCPQLRNDSFSGGEPITSIFGFPGPKTVVAPVNPSINWVIILPRAVIPCRCNCLESRQQDSKVVRYRRSHDLRCQGLRIGTPHPPSNRGLPDQQ